MKKLLLAVALTLPAFAASAADLSRRVAPPAPAPVFAGMDAFLSIGAGYNWAHVEMNETSGNPKGLELNARGSFAAPVSGAFGVQFDGQFERSAYSTSGPELRKNTAEVAGHAFWRDSSRGLVGVIGQASSTQVSFSMFSDRRYMIGGEAQYYIGNVTLYGQAAYENVNFGAFTSSVGAGATADGFVAAAQLRYFVNPNLMLALKGGYENLSASFLQGTLRHSAWLVGGKAEHRYTGTPFSVFAEADYRGGDFNVGGAKEHETRALVGVKLNFGPATLIERDRSGAGLDPIRSLKAIIPFYDRS